jgi:predicted nucleic acid-binding protein
MNASVPTFVDTNVFLYAASSHEGAKRQEALRWLDELWSGGTGRTSWQVINEFCANAIRKAGSPLPKIGEFVDLYALWNPAVLRASTVRRALQWMDRASLSYWDALILAGAEESGARQILSEDFQAGRRFGEIVIVNPFA